MFEFRKLISVEINKVCKLSSLIDDFFANGAVYPAVIGDIYEININQLPDCVLGRTSREELKEDPTNLQCRLSSLVHSRYRKSGYKAPISICIRRRPDGSKSLGIRWNLNQSELIRIYPELLKCVKD